MIDELRTFIYTETFIQRIFRNKDKVWNPEYLIILRF